MKWFGKGFHAISDCKRYEIVGEYRGGYFAWRGRFVQTDELVAASQDRDLVERMCERHEARLSHEASHGDELGGHPHDDNEADLAARAKA